ncbi:MAG: hypothetical protein SFZ23_00660 [Planctomycetota bacterium]|nr:hypothetical protein [Planctomycetota bacterium]
MFTRPTTPIRTTLAQRWAGFAMRSRRESLLGRSGGTGNPVGALVGGLVAACSGLAFFGLASSGVAVAAPTPPVAPVQSAPTQPEAAQVGAGSTGTSATDEAGPTFVKEPVPQAAQDLLPTERVGDTLPLHIAFKNSEAQEITLGTYFGTHADAKPAIVAMVYYRCPVVCGVVMDKIAQSVEGLDYTVGDQYRVLLFSFDPGESPQAAAAKKQHYLSGYSRGDTTEAKRGWEFHVGTEVASTELATALGFPFKPLDNGEFSHPVAMYIVSPTGKISRAFYGYDLPPSRDLKLALLDAAEGKIKKSVGDIFLSYCYRFDENTGRYTIVAFRVMQIAGAITVVCVFSLLGVLLVAERLRQNRAKREAAMAGPDGSPPSGNDSVPGSAKRSGSLASAS